MILIVAFWLASFAAGWIARSIVIHRKLIKVINAIKHNIPNNMLGFNSSQKKEAMFVKNVMIGFVNYVASADAERKDVP